MGSSRRAADEREQLDRRLNPGSTPVKVRSGACAGDHVRSTAGADHEGQRIVLEMSSERASPRLGRHAEGAELLADLRRRGSVGDVCPHEPHDVPADVGEVSR